MKSGMILRRTTDNMQRRLQKCLVEDCGHFWHIKFNMRQSMRPINTVTSCSSVRDLQLHILGSFHVNHPVRSTVVACVGNSHLTICTSGGKLVALISEDWSDRSQWLMAGRDEHFRWRPPWLGWNLWCPVFNCTLKFTLQLKKSTENLSYGRRFV